MKVLMVAFACQPGLGSEPGIGWNIARQVARLHEVWLLTRKENQPTIEEELARKPIPGLRVIYCDLPASLARFWSSEDIGWNAYYYLWQVRILPRARKLLQQHSIDIVHHVTYNRYWTPSFVSLLPVPFLWGPVGGGESTPKALFNELGRFGKRKERLRNIARWIGEHDPFLHLTARRCALALATTPETSERLRKLGAKKVETIGACALRQNEVHQLSSLLPPKDPKVRFISIGRLLHWKGFHLGIEAFERACIPNSEYWIIGDGSARFELEQKVYSSPIKEQYRFFGKLSREKTLERLAQSHVLVHPSLHDSGGWVCLEAMAAGRPIICLNIGGPAFHVTSDCGFKIEARSPREVITEMATAMCTLADYPQTRESMGIAGRDRVRKHFTWAIKAKTISSYYQTILKSQTLLTPALQE